MGRGKSRNSLDRGRNNSVSTPRCQRARLRKPWSASCLRMAAVLTMQCEAAPWNQRRTRYENEIEIGNRERRYCGNCVWYDVVKFMPRRTQYRLAAIPSGPSVAMCRASGLNSEMSDESLRYGNSDSRISG